MHRRFLLTSALAATFLAACSGPPLPTEISITTAQIQAAVGSKFPKNFPVAGLLQLQLQSPQLTMLPDSNQLRAVLPVQLSGRSLKQVFTGQLDVRFGLVYVPQDRTLRAQRVEVTSLSIDGAPEALSDMLVTYGPSLGEHLLENLVLHQLEDKDLSVATSVGLQPGAIRITEQGLTVALDKKPA